MRGVDWFSPESQRMEREGGGRDTGTQPERTSNTQITSCEPPEDPLWKRDSCLSTPWTSVPTQELPPLRGPGALAGAAPFLAHSRKPFLEPNLFFTRCPSWRRKGAMGSRKPGPALQLSSRDMRWLRGRAAWKPGSRACGSLRSICGYRPMRQGDLGRPLPKTTHPQDPLLIPSQAQHQPWWLGVGITALAGNRHVPSPNPTPSSV